MDTADTLLSPLTLAEFRSKYYLRQPFAAPGGARRFVMRPYRRVAERRSPVAAS